MAGRRAVAWTSLALRVAFLALLTGVAASWWHSLQTSGTAPAAWEVFKDALVRRFGDPKFGENMREELAVLKSNQAAAVLRGELKRILRWSARGRAWVAF